MPLPGIVCVSNVFFSHWVAKFSFSCWVATIDGCEPRVTGVETTAFVLTIALETVTAPDAEAAAAATAAVAAAVAAAGTMDGVVDADDAVSITEMSNKSRLDSRKGAFQYWGLNLIKISPSNVLHPFSEFPHKNYKNNSENTLIILNHHQLDLFYTNSNI